MTGDVLGSHVGRAPSEAPTSEFAEERSWAFSGHAPVVSFAAECGVRAKGVARVLASGSKPQPTPYRLAASTCQNGAQLQRRDRMKDQIAEKEHRLFDAWSARDESFVRDGIIDAEEYARCRVKLLFVLKEVNDSDGGGWDLREFLRGGGRGPTWNTVTRWVEGIQQLPHIVPWEALEDVDNDRRSRALRKIVAVNLKKEPGIGRGRLWPIESGDTARPAMDRRTAVVVCARLM